VAVRVACSYAQKLKQKLRLALKPYTKNRSSDCSETFSSRVIHLSLKTVRSLSFEASSRMSVWFFDIEKVV
jgi:hypothetical protein